MPRSRHRGVQQIPQRRAAAAGAARHHPVADVVARRADAARTGTARAAGPAAGRTAAVVPPSECSQPSRLVQAGRVGVEHRARRPAEAERVQVLHRGRAGDVEQEAAAVQGVAAAVGGGFQHEHAGPGVVRGDARRPPRPGRSPRRRRRPARSPALDQFDQVARRGRPGRASGRPGSTAACGGITSRAPWPEQPDVRAVQVRHVELRCARSPRSARPRPGWRHAARAGRPPGCSSSTRCRARGGAASRCPGLDRVDPRRDLPFQAGAAQYQASACGQVGHVDADVVKTMGHRLVHRVEQEPRRARTMTRRWRRRPVRGTCGWPPATSSTVTERPSRDERVGQPLALPRRHQAVRGAVQAAGTAAPRRGRSAPGWPRRPGPGARERRADQLGLA